jgi:hypothetical protein
VAPYQPDWSRLLTDDPFEQAEAEQALAEVPDLTSLGPSFVRAMAYEYTSFAGYLRQHEHDGFVMVIVGDHQPPAAVSGRDAPWHVPVHVITSRQGILDRLIDLGFRPGLEPRHGPIAPMHVLTTLLLEAFDAPAAWQPPVRLVSRDDEHPAQTTTPAP